MGAGDIGCQITNQLWEHSDKNENKWITQPIYFRSIRQRCLEPSWRQNVERCFLPHSMQGELFLFLFVNTACKVNCFFRFSISICEQCMQGELRLFFFLFLFVNNWTLQAGRNSYLYLYWNLFNIDYSDITQCKNWKVDDNHDCKYKFKCKFIK